MTLVRKIDGEWQALWGTVTLTEMADTAILHFRGKRPDETVRVEPYEIELAPMDAKKIERALVDGVWGDAEKAAYGVAIAEPFVPPEGKQAIGVPRYNESEGKVWEVFDVEDAPPAPPDPTPAEKIAALGLSRDDLKALLADD